MPSCNTTTSNATSSCTTASCSSCKCCHVQNVTVDSQLCVGNETQLRTCTSEGGALIVQNGCCTQTSGVLAHICGESGQVAFKTENGRVQMDPNEELVDDSVGVRIYNSVTQTAGELVQISGETEQIALKVAKGETHLVPNSNSGNALYIHNEAEQTSDELVLIDGTAGGQSGGVLLKVSGVSDLTALEVYQGTTELDPNSANGGALVVTNTETQSGGELVRIEGTVGQVAVRVSEGQTRLDPNSANGGALVVSNSNATQTSGQLVNITGTAGQVALQVDEGSTRLDSSSSTGEALIITSTTPQTSGILAHIDGTATQMALQVDNGNVRFDHVASADAVLTGGSIDDTPVGSNGASTGAFTTLSATDEIYVSGLQVVGAQQPVVADVSQSIPADGAISATYEQVEIEQLRDAVAELQTQVNSLLAKLRTHGLVAT